jgi:hypothetical protein
MVNPSSFYTTLIHEPKHRNEKVEGNGKFHKVSLKKLKETMVKPSSFLHHSHP